MRRCHHVVRARVLAIVASTASPSAPPICCEVLISPLARPDSCSRTPETAAIVVVTKANPRPAAASSDGPRMSVRKPPPTETCENQTSAGGDHRHPGREHRLEADPRDELGGDPGGDDDPEREGQVGEAGVDRAVAEHLLHVERDEEEHREQRRADQEPDDVGARQGPEAEDPERHQRRLRASLDRDEGGDQRRGQAEQAERLQRAPARVGRVDDRVDQDREAGGDGHRAGGVEVARRRLGAALGDQPRGERGDDRAPPARSPTAPTPSRGRR